MKLKKSVKMFVLLTIISAISVTTATYAKYATNAVWEYYLTSKEFYFTSDELNDQLKENTKINWYGESVYFNLKNSQNKELITEYDIDYKATCKIVGSASNSATCLLDGTGKAERAGVLSTYETCVNNTEDQVDVNSFEKTTCELEGYTWERQVAIKDMYFDIILNDEKISPTEIKVRVEVESTSPYKKKLVGEFALLNGLANNQNIEKSYEDYGVYGIVSLTNHSDEMRQVQVNFDPSKVLVDQNQETIIESKSNADYINEIILNVPAFKTYNIKFYKNNFTANITINDFVIELNNYLNQGLISTLLNKYGGKTEIDNLVKPDFNNVAVETDNNLYAAIDDYGKSYYFRGSSSLNNNIIFAQHQWKIIRINGNGSIRLIYNGTCLNNECLINNGGVETVIVNGVYNTYDNDNKFLGYMFSPLDDVESTSYEIATSNDESSNIKNILDTWYEENIVNKNYNQFVFDTLFCNDRQIHTGLGKGKNNTIYGTYNRILNESTPSLKCNQKNDRFTTYDNEIGNADLKHPIGLISIDEAVFAGMKNNQYNELSYLNNNQNYWTMSPSTFENYSSATSWIITLSGTILKEDVNHEIGVRPVINLKGNINITGEGSKENPFIVITE